MNRRTLLSALTGSSATVLAGCLDESGETAPSTNSTETESPTNSTDTESTESTESTETEPDVPTGDCGPGDAPLSELLLAEPGDTSSCFDGATPDLVVENARDDPVTATVHVGSDGSDGDDNDDDRFEATYDLEPGERSREFGPFEAAADLPVTVTVGDETFEDRWDDRSCRRHGIVIADGEVDVGWLEPLQGPADTQHDCYPGDDVRLEIGALEDSRTATVTIVDRCAGSRDEQTVDVDPDGRRSIEGALVSGGMYDITIDVDDGETETYEFRGDCWGVSATIEADGSVRVQQFEID